MKKRNCFLEFISRKVFGYISTIGVIDELRQLGLGRKLIEEAIYIMKCKSNCIGVFLHVVEYNMTAIKFYRKLNFN